MECVHPSLDVKFMCTYSGSHNTMEFALSFFRKQSSCTTQVLEKPNEHLVLMAHQPKCTFTFSSTIGVWIRGITFPSPLFMHCPLVHYIHMYIQKFQKSSKICGYSARIASPCSQVASSGLYQVH
jgi:hypothetical protein